MKITAKVMKCKAEDSVAGEEWCIYKHAEGGGTLKKQPKGWPKHFKTKKAAEKQMQMMHVFSSVRSWHRFLATVYAEYTKNPQNFKTKHTLLKNAKNPQVIAFVNAYPKGFKLLQFWASRYNRASQALAALAGVSKQLASSHRVEAKIVIAIVNEAKSRLSSDILKRYVQVMSDLDVSLDRNPPLPEPENKFGLEIGPALAPTDRELKTPRKTYNLVCPTCLFHLLPQMQMCPFCGTDPARVKRVPEEQLALDEVQKLQNYLG